MSPGPKPPKRPRPRTKGESSRGRADGPYIGVYNTDTHVGGQLIAAATIVRSAASYGLALRAAFGRTQS